MAPLIIDTHTHLSAPEFERDRDAVVERAKAAGVGYLITIGAGYGVESAKAALNVSESYDNVFATVGLHPLDAKSTHDLADGMAELRKLASHPKVVAIGETGLDFFKGADWKEAQEAWFVAQIALAREVNKPLVIHNRGAAEECFRVLHDNEAPLVGGVFHCFGESADFAKRLRTIGFLISIPGTVTFRNAQALRDALLDIPLDQIMVETDAPFLAPEPHRGKRCESAFTADTARRLAEVKGVSFEEVASATTANAIRLFRLPLAAEF